MTNVFRNNTIINCGTAMMIGSGIDIDIDGNTISNCGHGIIFEKELGVNAKVRNNKISKCGKGIVVGKNSHVPILNMAGCGPKLSQLTILVRNYLISFK